MSINHRSFKIIFLSLIVVSCSSIQGNLTNTQAVEPIKSPADDRSYRAITLENGLKVMLVSDAKADRAAAALDVHVGSGHDPKDRQGLAHYLEHMLFLGTQKYPNAGEYQQYISKHGGSNNAYTVLNHTNYFFNITPEYFEGALDRFSQFFIAPLFDEAYVKRERSIVHSEYTARRKNEGRRLWKARRQLYNPDHPSRQFSVGSLKTLADREGDPVREDLIAFYQQNYHASKMALAVISPDSLDQLQTWVEQKFSLISDQGAAYQPFNAPLINESDLAKQLTIKPLKETRQLNFSFPIESVEPYVESKPHAYLSNLLGHEGEGSLLALLKSRAWANSLSAGLGFSDEVQATFDIKISLSEAGFRHIDEIGSLLFSNIELIREQGVKQVYFDEIKQLAELDFRFQEKSDEGVVVQRLSSQLHRYPPEQVLSAPYLYSSFDAQHIQKILDRLRPNNLQLIITDPALESGQKTQWYDVAYAIDNINADWLEHWNQAGLTSEITLPGANPFIPDQLNLLSQSDEATKHPVKLKQTANIQVWHQTQTDFKQPKAELYFTLRSMNANHSARQSVLTELYVKAVEEALSAYTYPAYLAGLGYRIYRHSRGLSVKISGYSSEQAQLLDKIVETMQTVKLEQQQFDLHLENIKQSLENTLKGSPSDRVINGIYDVLLTSNWSTNEKLKALAGLTIVDLEQHKVDLLQDPDLLMLSVGNVSPLDSLSAGDVLSRLVSDTAKGRSVTRAKVRKLETGKWVLRHTPAQHDDAALALVYQGQAGDLKELAATQLLGALIRSPYYQTLRTEAEVGYIVSAFAFNVLDAPALGFSVQSNSHSVTDIMMQTDTFLKSFAQTLANLSDESYLATKAGLVARLSQEDKQLSDIASRYWSELDRQAYEFDTHERLVTQINLIQKADLSAYFQRLVLDDKATALLSYSFGDKSDKLKLLNKSDAIEYPSLASLRNAVKRYF